jgi:hypothetical protein
MQIAPIESLFELDSAVPKDLIKKHVAEDFKSKDLIGIPEAHLSITFSPDEDSDILIRRVDPENALGYSVFDSSSDYFNHLQNELYEPTDEEVLENLSE